MANFEEAGRRLNRAAIIVFQLSAAIACVVALVFMLTAPKLMLAALGIPLALAKFGVLLYIAGWVVEGLGIPKDESYAAESPLSLQQREKISQ
jgi:hypothetical protein